jgi:hypothetical protein
MRLLKHLPVRWCDVFLCFLFLFCIFVSCTSDTLSHTCSDPLGSENDLINDSVTNRNNSFFCFAGKSSDSCLYNKCFQLFTPQVIKSIYFIGCHPNSAGTIVDIGQVTCLGSISAKPSSGYSYSVAPMLHHGYVINFSDGTYGRFFIEAFEQESGQVTKMNITRQYPF